MLDLSLVLLVSYLFLAAEFVDSVAYSLDYVVEFVEPAGLLVPAAFLDLSLLFLELQDLFLVLLVSLALAADYLDSFVESAESAPLYIVSVTVLFLL